MKRILYIISALLLLVSCGEKEGGKDKVSLEKKLCAQWHSTQLPVDGEIYLNFVEDKTFELFQQIGEGKYRLYRGTWNLEGNLLTGKYNDGEDWSAAYTIEITDQTLSMTSSNTAAEVSVYTKAEIPAEVKEDCVVVVKSN